MADNDENMEAFFSKIDSLSNGERATLRREAGIMLNHTSGRALAVFYKCKPVQVNKEDVWFAIACLRCLWDAGISEGNAIEKIISALINQEEISDSTAHRVELLLDTKWDSEGGYMLTKLVRLIKLIRQKSETMIDFNALLKDLLSWNNENQHVQRKWARTIFSKDSDSKNSQTQNQTKNEE
ncbi:MAG: type I-E CRISPR-associated protein Cse2/CasB [Succinimonas sp.]|nr:type I-E CRISPR-associated protein Cse2/CasB [Succinimonas sp.]